MPWRSPHCAITSYPAPSKLQTLAGFCLDLGHARQIDPTMASALRMLRELGHRLRQVHVSEVGSRGEHLPLGSTARLSFRQVAHRLPSDCPLIIESVIPLEAME